MPDVLFATFLLIAIGCAGVLLAFAILHGAPGLVQRIARALDRPQKAPAVVQYASDAAIAIWRQRSWAALRKLDEVMNYSPECYDARAALLERLNARTRATTDG